jgi:hypothetical protein
MRKTIKKLRDAAEKGAVHLPKLLTIIDELDAQWGYYEAAMERIHTAMKAVDDEKNNG